jgi:hypothetical protein
MNHATELITRILCDQRPAGPVDGAYLFCTTVDNQTSQFVAARRLIRDRIARCILILESKPMSGYPGSIQFRKGLVKSGLTKEQIRGVPAGTLSSINTLTESEALIQFAKEKGVGDLVVVSPPFHQLRAFMTAVSVALRIHPKLEIYSFPGAAMPWMEVAVHSQGTVPCRRHDDN